MKTIALFRQITLLLIGLFLCSCFPHAYSPSLDLAHDNLRRGQVRLGGALELAPHAESASLGDAGVLPAVQAQAAFGLSTNSELHLKMFSNGFNGVGAVLSGSLRVSHGEKTDVLLMPRIGTSSIFGSGGQGGGGAVVLRKRNSSKLATWGGLGYYHGWYEGMASSGFDVAESGRHNGNAFAFHLGGSYKLSDVTQLSFEFNPLVQRDSYFNRSAFVPAAKVGVSFTLNERRYLEAERARKLKNQ